MSNHRILVQPSITPVMGRGGKRLYRLDDDYTYTWQAEGHAWRVRVPAGFEYDGASNPWWLWTITRILPDGLGRAAALVHDWLYIHEGRLPHGSFYKLIEKTWVAVPTSWRRRQADKLFANMLNEAGETRVRRRIMYLGVRLCGWIFWRS